MTGQGDVPLAVMVADLDGTLIHSARRCPDPDGMVIVERYDDRDVGFMTPACWTALEDLQALAELIPVTSRVRRQYDRIRFPRQPRVAVIEAGARILVDGTPDPAWDARTAAVVASTEVSPAEVAERMALLETTEPVRTGELALVNARVGPQNPNAFREFEQWCMQHGWTTVDQDGRIYVLPDGIGKAQAAVRAAELAGGAIVVAAGDGLMDEAMLRAAPLALTPEHGPLWTSGRRFATAVAGFGPLTAERIVLHAIIAVTQYRSLPSGTQGSIR